MSIWIKVDHVRCAEHEGGKHTVVEGGHGRDLCSASIALVGISRWPTTQIVFIWTPFNLKSATRMPATRSYCPHLWTLRHKTSGSMKSRLIKATGASHKHGHGPYLHRVPEPPIQCINQSLYLFGTCCSAQRRFCNFTSQASGRKSKPIRRIQTRS